MNTWTASKQNIKIIGGISTADEIDMPIPEFSEVKDIIQQLENIEVLKKGNLSGIIKKTELCWYRWKDVPYVSESSLYHDM